MKFDKRLLCGGLALLLGAGSELQAENLWQNRTPERGYLFFDSKARNVGDLVTVIISQNTDVDHRENRGLQKATESKGLFKFDSAAGGGFGEQGANATGDFAVTSGRKFDGTSNFQSGQAITDRVTATVMDVLPNGNLVISGRRRMRVAGEERTLVLSGVIRGLDLDPDNCIHSRYISEFRLEYESGGVSQRFTRQGWLGRAVNVVWPF